jgi:hypothetical protein
MIAASVALLSGPSIMERVPALAVRHLRRRAARLLPLHRPRLRGLLLHLNLLRRLQSPLRRPDLLLHLRGHQRHLPPLRHYGGPPRPRTLPRRLGLPRHLDLQHLHRGPLRRQTHPRRLDLLLHHRGQQFRHCLYLLPHHPLNLLCLLHGHQRHLTRLGHLLGHQRRLHG